jgi:hypothetical protein
MALAAACELEKQLAENTAKETLHSDVRSDDCRAIYPYTNWGPHSD